MPGKSKIKKWMWKMDLGFRVGIHLWNEMGKRNLTRENVLARLAKNGIEIKPEILDRILNGRCRNINQLQLVALALGLPFSQVVQECEDIGSDKDVKKDVTRFLAQARRPAPAGQRLYH